jgi:hypothetical protein
MKAAATTIALAAVLWSGVAGAQTEPDPTTGFASPETPAAGAPGLGAPGQYVLTMGAFTGQHFLFHKQGDAWQLSLQPALDYFLTSRFSVGALVRYTHLSGGAGTGANDDGTNAFSLGARAGAHFAVNSQFSVWPMGGLIFDWRSVNHSSSTNTWLALWAPVLFHPAPHFFAGLGPTFQLGLTGDGANQFGIDSMLGGWF